MRSGSLFTTCQESRTWSPEIPTCEKGTAIKKYYQIFTFLDIG